MNRYFLEILHLKENQGDCYGSPNGYPDFEAAVAAASHFLAKETAEVRIDIFERVGSVARSDTSRIVVSESAVHQTRRQGPAVPHRDQFVWVIGMELSPGRFSMIGGPFASPLDALNVAGDPGACILRCQPDGGRTVAYRWEEENANWASAGTDNESE